jgi:deazaflavin-dependent oxidoreductase (nitroreductase family)
MIMMVDVPRAFAGGGVVEITTTGRRSGQPRRIPIAIHSIDGRTYVSGSPGPRGWYANLLAKPELVVHLSGEEGLAVDLPAHARPIAGLDERRRVLRDVAQSWGVAAEPMIERSPLVELTFVEPLAELSRLGRDRRPMALVEV